MIPYKIGKYSPYYRSRYLSNRVKQKKVKLLGRMSSLSVIKNFIEQYWLVLVGPILFVFLLVFFDLKGNGNIEFLKGTFTIPLSLIGIIIPIIILFITTLDKKSSYSLVKSYIMILNPLMVFWISAIFLSINVILFFFNSMNYSFINDMSEFFICLELTSIFTPLVGAIVLVFRTMHLIDDGFLYDVMEKQMSKEIMKSLEIESSNKIKRRIMEEECLKFNLEFRPGFFGRREYLQLKASKRGIIKDIDIANLEKFGTLIKEIENNEDIEINGIIVKYPEQNVSVDNNILGYINLNEKYIPNLELELNKAFIIV